MVAEKMKPYLKNNSAIRMMFEEGNRLKALYGPENVFDFSLGNPSVPAPDSVRQAIIDLVNETVRLECEALGIRYVDLAAGLKGEDGLLPAAYCGDGLVHLNDDGYEIFARELLDFAQAEYEAGNWIPEAAED